MSLVKVNLLPDFDSFALYPFKRFFIKRKNDQQYQLATNEHAAKLRRLYQTNEETRKERISRKKLELVSATLRLDGSQLNAKKLHGMTIASSSFPLGEPGEQVILVDDSQKILAEGIIQAVTESDIKIKLSKPLVLEAEEEKPKKKKKEEAEPEAAASKSGADSGSESSQHEEEEKSVKSIGESADSSLEATLHMHEGGLSGAKKDDDDDSQSESSQSSKEAELETATSKTDAAAVAAASTKSKIVDFKIRLNPDAIRAARNNVDEYNMLVIDVLAKFEQLKCDPVIHKNLLGFYDERSDLLQDKARVMAFDELLKPRGQQRVAIEQALKRRMSLVEGPAGSGKTLVAAYIAANMSRLKRAKILVCSAIQANVDKLARIIDKVDGVQVVKLPEGPVKLTLSEVLGQGQPPASKRSSSSSKASSYLDLDAQSSHCHLDKLVDDEIYLHAWNRSRDTLRNHHESLHSHAYRMVTSCSQHRRRELESKILARADVVCCTSKQAGSYLLDKFEFDMLILDDVQVASEIDCLVPMMVRGIKQVVLLSDSRKRIRLARSLKRSQSSVLRSREASNHVEQQDIKPAPVAATPTTTMAPPTTTPSPTPTASRQNGTRSNRSSLRRMNYRKARESPQPKANGLDARAKSTTAISAAGQPGASSWQATLEPGGLFERLLAVGLPTVDLRVQFRMQEALSNFTNHHFYLGRLKDDQETNDKLKAEIETSLLMGDEKRFEWLPNRKYLTAMFNIKTSEEAEVTPSTSSSSPSSATGAAPVLSAAGQERGPTINSNQMIEKLDDIVSKLLSNENVQGSRIGVIFNRKIDKQTEWVKKIPKNISLGTIADFIGQERDFIILVALPNDTGDMDDDESSTKAKLSICSEIQCDFKHDDGALNCALTRARLGLILIAADIIVDDDGEHATGNCNADGKQQPIGHGPEVTDGCCGWTDLVRYYKASGLMVS